MKKTCAKFIPYLKGGDFFRNSVKFMRLNSLDEKKEREIIYFLD
jgi:hypothetical protein